jgi:hypothetical protein
MSDVGDVAPETIEIGIQKIVPNVKSKSFDGVWFHVEQGLGRADG